MRDSRLHATGEQTPHQVAAPLHIAVVRGEGGVREIEVSFTARVGVSSANGAYQLVGDTPSPTAEFGQTSRDIKPGERIALREWAPKPGTYTATITYTEQAPVPYPVYLYGKGPVVGTLPHHAARRALSLAP